MIFDDETAGLTLDDAGGFTTATDLSTAIVLTGTEAGSFAFSHSQ